MKDKNVNIQEVQQTPSKMNSERSTLKLIIIKLSKDKEQILKAAKEKQIITYKGSLIRLSVDFLSETIEATRK